jgi:hypothetical protein
VDTRFQVLFHSPPGVLFTFPSRYFFAIGHQVVFSLRRVFIYRAFTFFGGAFQLSSINLFTSNVQPNPRNKFLVWALSLSLAATKEIDFSFSSSGYLDVSVPRVYPYKTIYSFYSTMLPL